MTETLVFVCILIIVGISILATLTASQSVSSNNADEEPTGRVMAVFIDGLSTKYLNKIPYWEKALGLDFTGIRMFYQRGTRASYMQPVFPPKTWPNAVTLVSGNYVNSHGIIGNYMHYKERDIYFRNGTNSNAMDAHWWQHVEPIWITAERQGRRAQLYYTLACEATYNGRKAQRCVPWNRYKVGLEYFTENLNAGIDLLKTGEVHIVGTSCKRLKPGTVSNVFNFDTPSTLYAKGQESTQRNRKLVTDVMGASLDLGNEVLRETMEDSESTSSINDTHFLCVAYFQMIDSYGHIYGPDSDKIGELLSVISKILQQYMERLDREHLTNVIDTMVFSDHGMTAVSQSRAINITGHIDKSDYIRMFDSGPVIYVWPKPDRAQKVYDDLKRIDPTKMTVYWKHEIPARWNFREHERIPEILGVATPGQYITTPWSGFRNYGNYPRKGEHGFENTDADSRGSFLAAGPHFKSNHISEPIENVDVYQMMCEILDIKPARHSGVWSRVAEFYMQPESYFGSGVDSVSCSCFCILVTVVLVREFLHT